MTRELRFAVVGFGLAAIVACVNGCSSPPPPPDPAYVAEIEAWRSDRLQRLQADDGWLTLVGLYWLEPGDNTIGRSAGNAVVLSAPGIPEHAGVITLDESGASFLRPADGVNFLIDGEPVGAGRPLSSDVHGSPDEVRLQRIRFFVIERDGRFAVRVKDPEAPTRVAFRGIETFPIDEAMRVRGRFVAYDQPKEVHFATAIGTEDVALAPGVVQFELAGKACSLEPWAPDSASDLFFVFRDATSGDTSYGAGRFLSTPAPVDGVVDLDFNKAVNPPCAFTPFATCPLAPPANVLQVAVTAGERYTGPSH